LSVCVDKIAHDCGSSDGLQVFQREDGTVNGYCFSCGTYVPDPYGDNPVPEFTPITDEERQEKVKAYAKYPVHDLPERKLKRSALMYYGCRMEVSQEDGVTPTAVLFPYGKDGTLHGWKVRPTATKDMWCVGTVKNASLFGWSRAITSGERTLYITEGEYDAVALYQVLKDSNAGTQYADQNPAVISLRSGATSAKRDLNELKSEINSRFDNVVLCFDMDEPGQQAAEDVCRSNPGWKVAVLPCKDANDCLMQGASKALKAAVVFRAEKPKNSRVLRASSLHDAARKPAQWGLSTPYPKLTEMSRGFRDGETWYWGAGVKMGKSELVNDLAAHMIKAHGRKVLACKPEEAPGKSYKMLAGKMTGNIFHDPKVDFNFEAYDKAGAMIGDDAFFLDIYQFLGWDALQEDIIYMVESEGVKDVIIDPITCFTNGMDPSTINTFLQGLAAEAAALAKDLDILMHLFCHLNTPNGTPHERGGEVFSNQFAGSRGMMRSCNYMIGVEGNKDPELSEDERNIRTLKMLEDREFGMVGTVDLFWNRKTGMFSEI
jgi:twinkle protein